MKHTGDVISYPAGKWQPKTANGCVIFLNNPTKQPFPALCTKPQFTLKELILAVPSAHLHLFDRVARGDDNAALALDVQSVLTSDAESATGRSFVEESHRVWQVS
jgi:hypothetical protein